MTYKNFVGWVSSCVTHHLRRTSGSRSQAVRKYVKSNVPLKAYALAFMLSASAMAHADPSYVPMPDQSHAPKTQAASYPTIQVVRIPVDPKTQRTATLLWVTMNGDARLINTLSALRPAMVARVTSIDPSGTKDASEIVDTIILPEFKSRIGDFRQPIIDVYSRHFSISELKQLIAFFGSPIGVKWLDETPQMSEDIQALTADVAQRTIPEILKKYADEFRKRGIQP